MTKYDLVFTFNNNLHSSMSCGADTIEEVYTEIKRQYDYFTWYPNMTVEVTMPCTTCKGSGEVPRTKRSKWYWDTKPCKDCKGIGRSPTDISVNVKEVLAS